VGAHNALRRRGFNVFLKIGSQMAVRLSALRADRPLPPEIFLVLISVTPAILWLKDLIQLKNPMTSSGIETATSRFVAQCHSPLRYRVYPSVYIP
jgi:hypothetical protein